MMECSLYSRRLASHELLEFMSSLPPQALAVTGARSRRSVGCVENGEDRRRVAASRRWGT